MDIESILVPIFVCVVLPVAIVWIVFSTARNNDNKRAEVLIKAIENNAGVDTDRLAEALNKTKKPKTPRELQLGRLLRGCIFSLIGASLTGVSFMRHTDERIGLILFGCISAAIGIAYLVVYFVGRKAYRE